MTELTFTPHGALPVWGWEIAVYLFLGGIAAGIMILAATLRGESRAARLLIFGAPLALSAGMLALFIDLGQKLHVFRFYTALRLTSPMSWGAWILLLIYPVTILYGLVILSREDGEGSHGLRSFAALRMTLLPQTELLRRLNLVLGIALGAYTGILLGTLTARAAWGSMFLAPLFLVSGISTAAATALLLPLTEAERDRVRRWDLMAISVEAVLLALFFLDLRGGASLFFGGPYTAAFWSLVVIAGLAAPAALEIAEARRRVHIALAPALILIGGLALRWIFVLAGQTAI